MQTHAHRNPMVGAYRRDAPFSRRNRPFFAGNGAARLNLRTARRAVPTPGKRQANARSSKPNGRGVSPRRPFFAAQPPLSLFGQDHERPVPPIRNQSGADGIFENILCFVLETFVVSQSMFKKIPLPIESMCACCPPFPVPDTFDQIRFRRKPEHKVDMIGHNGGGMDPPNTGLHTMADRIPNAARCFMRGKRLLRTVLGAARDEKHRTMEIDPRGKIVW